MSEALEGVGLIRVLDGIEASIDAVHRELKEMDTKVDRLADKKVDKSDFDAYQEIRAAVTSEAEATRKSQFRYSLTTIISVLMLLVAFATLIIMTRPELIAVPGPESMGFVGLF